MSNSNLVCFCFTTLCDWLKRELLSQPIRSKTQTNRDLPACVFPRLAPGTCICSEFWFVHCIDWVCCDWSGWLLCFWFYDTQLKTARSIECREDMDLLSVFVKDHESLRSAHPGLPIIEREKTDYNSWCHYTALLANSFQSNQIASFIFGCLPYK